MQRKGDPPTIRYEGLRRVSARGRQPTLATATGQRGRPEDRAVAVCDHTSTWEDWNPYSGFHWPSLRGAQWSLPLNSVSSRTTLQYTLEKPTKDCDDTDDSNESGRHSRPSSASAALLFCDFSSQRFAAEDGGKPLPVKTEFANQTNHYCQPDTGTLPGKSLACASQKCANPSLANQPD